MKHAISPALQKMFALFLLAAGLFTLYGLAVAPVWHAIVSTKDAIATDRYALGRLIEPAQPTMSDPQAAALPALGDTFLAGASNASRVANLQSRIGKIADTLAIDVKSRREIALEDRDGMLLLGIELIVTADNKRLLDFLRVVEAERPRLFVETLRITPATIASSASSDAQPDRQPQLDINLRIVGAVERGKV